jgi:hypothetical protein
MNAPLDGWSWSGVQGESLAGLWNVVWPMLEPCVEMDTGRYDEDSLFEAIRLGDMQLWLAGHTRSGALLPSLAVTTEIRVYPKSKWLTIKYVGGKGLPFAFDFLGTLEAWGHAQGCVGCEGYGRDEWSRLLQRNGYRVRGQGYEKTFQGPENA